MIVTLNGYTLNDPSTNVFLDEDMTGLSLPMIRTSSGTYSGRDGGYVGSQFYDIRSVALIGHVFANDLTTLETRRRDLQDALRSKAITMRIVTNAGHAYVLYCNLSTFDMPINRDLFRADFKIELIAPDPVIYDDTAGGLLSASLTRISGGGLTWPLTWSLVWAPGSSPTAINNGGSVPVYPLITLTGSMTNPVITNITTGQAIALNGLTTSTSDTVVIDLKNRTVLLDGGNILPYVTSSSTWWPLIVGNNSVSLTTSGSGDTVTALIQWKSGYMGI